MVRVSRRKCKQTKMARDSFLLKFEKLSVDLSSNTAIYYIRDATFSSFGISYSELNRLSSELSQYFLKLFKKSRQYIGVRLSDRLWVSCLLLGIWKSGNAFAGIGCHFTQEEYLKFLERLKIKYIITDVETHNYNSSLAYEFQINNQKFFVWERQDQENLQFLHWDMCFGIMTSGSTGIPKVVQVPWNCILPNAEELKNIFEITSPDNIYQVSPYTFDPFFIDVFLAFTSGASITFTCEQMKFSYDDLIHILFLKENNDCFCNNKEFL
jgi:acyl-coenzyme A synthetase/AMP-(fatty) acid ligase